MHRYLRFLLLMLALLVVSHPAAAQRRGGGGGRGGGGFRGGGGGGRMARASARPAVNVGRGSSFNPGMRAGFNRPSNPINRPVNRPISPVNRPSNPINRPINGGINNRPIYSNRPINTGDIYWNGGEIHDHVDWGCCYHPLARAAAWGTAAAVTSAAVGSTVYTLPPSCTTVVVNGTTYQQCGSTWYEPQFTGTDVTYVTVAAPQ